MTILIAKGSRAMSRAAKLQLKHSTRYLRPFHSSPSGIALVLIDKPSPKRDGGAANSEGADAPGCRTLGRSAKENIREEGTISHSHALSSNRYLRNETSTCAETNSTAYSI